MVDDAEWAWIEAEIRSSAGLDHLLIGTSLPFLLPRGLHHVESWNEAVAAGAWGRAATKTAERIRQGIDLEHWAAFEASHRRLSVLVTALATGSYGPPPATITFLSGDVHYSYAATASYHGQASADSRTNQLVCSPIRNPLSPVMPYLNVLASFGLAAIMGTTLAKAARVPEPPLDWTISAGPVFDNALATIDLDGRGATLRWETASADRTGIPTIRELAGLEL